ncbi:MAG: hypothetical protein RLZZ56_522 [Actinomycetota bacterium]|jgi:hypothetical protein
MGEHLSYKYNDDQDEFDVYFEKRSKQLSISRYVRSAECIYDSKYSHLQQYAKIKGSVDAPWDFLKKEFAEGRGPEFSDWVMHNVPVGHIDSDYFQF